MSPPDGIIVKRVASFALLVRVRRNEGVDFVVGPVEIFDRRAVVFVEDVVGDRSKQWDVVIARSFVDLP